METSDRHNEQTDNRTKRRVRLSDQMEFDTYDIDDRSSDAAARLGRHGGEDVAVWLLQKLERHGEMMVFQHGFVIVDQRQLRV